MSWFQDFQEIVQPSAPLAPHTWFKLGGPAEFFARPTSLDQLIQLVRRCHDQSLAIRILGGGSNVLVRDQGVPGVVVRLDHPAFQEITVIRPHLRAGGGAALGQVISAAVRAGLAGIEPLVGIPGSVGGALHGNSGSHGTDVGQWTRRATVMTRAGDIIQHEGEDLVFSYRQSSLDALVILEAEFVLEEDDPEQLTKRMQKQWIVKKASQPMAHQPAECVFKNHRGLSASSLVEQAGLKGMRIGGAEVCQQDANFIIVQEGATSDDVLRLIDHVRKEVADRLDVELELALDVW
ncbi:MAG: UDP-N-acetylmuramate dehydrogenase [Pirellulales bacterium]